MEYVLLLAQFQQVDYPLSEVDLSINFLALQQWLVDSVSIIPFIPLLVQPAVDVVVLASSQIVVFNRY